MCARQLACDAAVKWRFLDQQKNGDGVDMSMFPRVIFNIVRSSPRRGLSEAGTRFQIPFQMSKAFGRWHGNVEFGPHISSVGRSEWLSGIVAGLDVSKRTLLMAELHGTSRMNFTRDVLTVNVGVHHEFSQTRILDCFASRNKCGLHDFKHPARFDSARRAMANRVAPGRRAPLHGESPTHSAPTPTPSRPRSARRAWP